MGEQTLEFPCRQCGAKLQFAPGSQRIACGYCGYSEDVPAAADQVVEHPFEDYKADAIGWGTELKRFDCEQCGSRTEVEPHVVAWDCPFCGSGQVVLREASETLHQPESLIPFQIEQKECLERFRTWIKGLWFRPNALTKMARPDKLRGIYLPFWTYDSLTSSWWTAQAGYYYYTTDDEGNRERHTRWESVAGDHHELFDDVLVQGSPSVSSKLLGGIQPYDTTALVSWKPEFLSGMAAEDYRRDMLECWPDAKSTIDSAIYSACSRKVPGDTQRGLSVTTSYLNRTYKLCLLPLWIASYRYRNKPYTWIVNGQSGRVSGTAPWSVIKIALFVLAIAAAIGGIVWFRSH